MAISASSKSYKNQHVFLKSRIVQFLRHIRTMFCRRKFFRYKLLTNTPTGYIIDKGRPFRSYPEKRRKAVSIMVKTTLKIDGMMCSMCEAHMNDLVRQNCSVRTEKPLSSVKNRWIFLCWIRRSRALGTLCCPTRASPTRKRDCSTGSNGAKSSQ